MTKTKKVVYITGGSRGIGRGIADAFHSDGYAVAICSRQAEKMENPNGYYLQNVDVRHRDEIKRFVDGATKALGKPDVFVNCAGISQWRPLQKIDEDFMRLIYETNVLGVLWGSQAAASVLEKGGSIVNVSSLAGKRGSANNSAYCASKFAVTGLTQALAKELGPKEIRVNSVCPVYIETDEILKSLSDPESPAEGKSVKDYLNEFTKTQTALKRLPTIHNVAETVLYLAGPKAGAITGQSLNVDCGTLPS